MSTTRMADGSLPNYPYGRSATPPESGKSVGLVQHQDTRGTNTRTSGVKGLDAGSAGAVAALGRPKAQSDYDGPTPEDHVVAPGQRTMAAPKGTPAPTKMY